MDKRGEMGLVVIHTAGVWMLLNGEGGLLLDGHGQLDRNDQNIFSFGRLRSIAGLPSSGFRYSSSTEEISRSPA